MRRSIFHVGASRLNARVSPGIFFILPCIETYTKVDLRTGVFDIPPQEVSGGRVDRVCVRPINEIGARAPVPCRCSRGTA